MTSGINIAAAISGRSARLLHDGPAVERVRQRLLGVLDSPEIRPGYEAFVRTGEKLMKINDALIRKLKEIRLKLSLEHDVPYVAAQEKLEATLEWQR